MSDRKCPIRFSGDTSPWLKSENADSTNPSRMCESLNVNPKRAEKFNVQAEITFFMEIFSCVMLYF